MTAIRIAPGAASPPRCAWRAFIALLCLIAPACEPGSFSEAPDAACSTIGSQCQLADGPLGVCQEAPCEAGQSRPCFKCTAQH